MADEKETENEKTNAKLDHLLSGLDTIVNGYNSLADRMDALEGKGKKPGAVDPPLDADEDDDDFGDLSPDEQKRWTEEERARAMKEGRAPGAPEQLAADARKRHDAMRASETADQKRRRMDSRRTDAQARCDSVSTAHGLRAPKPLQAEGLTAYRRRLLRDHQHHSATYKDVDLGAVKGKLLQIAEASIFADSLAVAKNPQLAAGGQRLRMSEDSVSSPGHLIRSFYGDTGEFIGMFSGNGQIATIDVRGARPN